ncbi:MAG: hypothetical protein HXY46_08610 [Syntrophaceae bacterium]|nr:hypothetical protein [Syntrophaceae bacterium]
MGTYLLTAHWTSLFALFLLVLGIIAWILTGAYKKSYGLAEEARRAYVMNEALGWPIPKKKLTEFFQRFSKKSLTKARGTTGTERWFASEAPPGPKRLLECSQESFFWTHRLMQHAARWALGITIGGLICVALVLYSVAFTPWLKGSDLLARVIIAVVLSLITSGFYSWCRLFRERSAQVRDLDNELEYLKTTQYTLEDVLRIVHEYDCLIMDTPPVPDFIYSLHRDELNKLWKMRTS